MSSNTDAAEAAEIVATFSDLYGENFCTIAASSLFIYEVLITFDREVACFWTPKRSAGASRLLFLANRWIYVIDSIVPLMTTVPVGMRYMKKSCQMTPAVRSCNAFVQSATALIVLAFVPMAIFSALRGYVLSRSKLLGLLILVLSLAPVGANLAKFGYDLSGVLLPPFGCLGQDDMPAEVDLKLLITSRVPLIIADMLLICITWMKLNGRGAMRDVRLSRKLSLSETLLCDGTIYFVVLFIMNALHLVLSLCALEVAEAGTSPSHVTAFTGPLTAILVSRFLLDLQEANSTVVGLDHDDSQRASGDPYNDAPSFISSLGAFINPDTQALSDQDLELHVQGGSTDLVDKEGNREAVA